MHRHNLEEVTSPFTNRFHTLTHPEVNICTLMRNGLRTKEIAQLRGISAATINRHRKHIRKKLGIANEKINLTTYLQSQQAAEPSSPEKKGQGDQGLRSGPPYAAKKPTDHDLLR